MQNLYQRDFSVELIGVDFIAPKSCSAYIPGKYTHTHLGLVLALVKVGTACCQPLSSLSSDMEDPNGTKYRT